MFEKPLIKTLLLDPSRFKWTLQGFGMLRTYLDAATVYRLNIWDSRYRVPDVSLVHTHPWDFQSLIVAGKLTNVKFAPNARGAKFHAATIIPGIGGGLIEQSRGVKLALHSECEYSEGEIYEQRHNEIHISLPEDGTVTLNKRTRIKEDKATVFWLDGKQWVSAEPRPATEKEIKTIIGYSLDKWFNS